jgi:hypothetical protein
LLGEPTYRIETSPLNEQWGYRLDPPVTSEPVASALIEAVIKHLVGDAPDPGMAGVTRYLRLPVGTNGKAGLDKPKCALWALDRDRALGRDEQRALAGTLGVDLSAVSPGGGDNSSTAPGPGGSGRTLDDLAEHDVLFQAMRRLGLVQGTHARNSAMGRAWDVVCPWSDEHTGRATSGTAYVPTLHRFQCHHGHCAGRTAEHLGERLDHLLREDSFGLVGMVDVEWPDLTPEELAALQRPSEGADDAPPRFMLCGPASTVQMPKRLWAAKDRLLRGAVTLLFGPPDQGKSLLLVRWAVNFALGRSFGGLKPGAPCRVLTLFAEEDADEQHRRIEAALLAEQATHADLHDRLRMFIPADLATMFMFNRTTRRLGETRIWQALIEAITTQAIDVLVLDPMVELHTAEENDNVQLKAVISKLRSLARQHNIAVLLCHHSSKISRKEGLLAGNLDAVRGASAIGGAVRTAFSLVEMEEAECRALGVAPELRRYYVRLDLARNSQAAPARVAEWYHKLGMLNANGDETATLEPWSPPAGTQVDAATLDALVADIGAGCATANGIEPWSPSLDNYPRSLRALFEAHGLMDRPTQERTWQTLQTQHHVVVAVYRKTTKNRTKAQGVRTTTGLPSVKWEAD